MKSVGAILAFLSFLLIFTSGSNDEKPKPNLPCKILVDIYGNVYDEPPGCAGIGGTTSTTGGNATGGGNGTAGGTSTTTGLSSGTDAGSGGSGGSGGSATTGGTTGTTTGSLTTTTGGGDTGGNGDPGPQPDPKPDPSVDFTEPSGLKVLSGTKNELKFDVTITPPAGATTTIKSVSLLVNSEIPIPLKALKPTGGWEIRIDSTHFQDSSSPGVSPVSFKLKIVVTVTPSGGAAYDSTVTTQPITKQVFNRVYAMATSVNSNGYSGFYETDYSTVAGTIGEDANSTATITSLKCIRATTGDVTNQSDLQILDCMTMGSVYLFATHGAPDKFWPSLFTYSGQDIAISGTVLGVEGQNNRFWLRKPIKPKIDSRIGLSGISNEPNLFLLYACSTLSVNEDIPIAAKLVDQNSGRAFAGFNWDVYSTVGFQSLPLNYGQISSSNTLKKHYRQVITNLLEGQTIKKAIDNANSIYPPFTTATFNITSETPISENPLLLRGDGRYTALGVYLAGNSESNLFDHSHISTWYWIPITSRP